MNTRLCFASFFALIIITIVPAIAHENFYNTSNNLNLISHTHVSTKLANSGECPYPLISLEATGLSRTNTSLCMNDCCLSCPIVNNFYKEDKIDLIFHILCTIRMISFICILIIVISYIVLPNKREHPALIVLYFNASLLLFTGVTFFYMGDIRRVQCADLITQATMKNNTLCGIQGVILISTTFLLILWCFFLILHLHFETVWRSNIIQRYHIILQILVVVIAAVFTIIPTAMGKISFDFGAVCLVSQDYSKQLFWYPLAFFAIPGVIVHFWTFTYIGKSHCMISTDYNESTLVTEDRSEKSFKDVTGKEIVRAIRIQWRALMLALILLVTFSIYWIYSLIELGKLKFFEPDSQAFLSWLGCIFENGINGMDAQNKCSSHMKDYVPNVVFLVIAESSTALLGISIFIVFGTSIDLWSEWRLYFAKKFFGVSRSGETNVQWV